jgi:hypothetical protein
MDMQDIKQGAIIDLDEWDLSEEGMLLANVVSKELQSSVMNSNSSFEEKEHNQSLIFLSSKSPEHFENQISPINKLLSEHKNVSRFIGSQNTFTQRSCLKSISRLHQDQTLLIIGHADFGAIMEGLGFKKYITVEELITAYPFIFISAYRKTPHDEIEKLKETLSKRLDIPLDNFVKDLQIGAIVIWNNSL